MPLHPFTEGPFPQLYGRFLAVETNDRETLFVNLDQIQTIEYANWEENSGAMSVIRMERTQSVYTRHTLTELSSFLGKRVNHE